MSVDINTDDSTDSNKDARYDETNKKSYGSQQEVADAWSNYKFPTHNTDEDGAAIVYTGSPVDSRFSDAPAGPGTNFYGVQNPDGSGTLMHYRTREAVRLSDGTQILNQQCWQSGFSHCSHPPDSDYRLPLDAVETLLDQGDTLEDITDVLGQPTSTWSRGEVHRSLRVEDSIVVINDGDYGIYLGEDRSVVDGNSSMAFKLSAAQLSHLPEDTPAEIVPKMFLRPPEVQNSYMDVVDSGEFTKHRLGEGEANRHEACGGSVERVTTRSTRNRYKNYQQFRADQLGSTIIRHGDWFFLPVRDDIDPEMQAQETARKEMGNHSPSREDGVTYPYPESCDDCDSSSVFIDNDGSTSCEDCGMDLDRTMYVRGQVKHDNGDHNAINLKDQWHVAVENGADVLMYDDNPVAGGRSARYE